MKEKLNKIEENWISPKVFPFLSKIHWKKKKKKIKKSFQTICDRFQANSPFTPARLIV